MNTNDVKYGKDDLVPVITQDEDSGKVLMLAYAKQEQIDKTLKTNIAHYYSRSRNREWIKGETSGNVQNVVKVMTDCDSDAILYIVKQKGNACHTGRFSCFYRVINEEGEISDE